MVAVEDREFGKLVLFGFLLEQNEQKQIDAFNDLLSEMGLHVQLQRHNGECYWIDDVTGESVQAEHIFTDIVNFIPEESFKGYLDQGRFNFLMEQYDLLVRDEMRRMETLRWLSEFVN